MLHLSTRFDYYYAGLLFGGLASTVRGYLWFKSRYIPRSLAAFGAISSAFCVACTFVFYVFPDFGKTVNSWWTEFPASDRGIEAVRGSRSPSTSRCRLTAAPRGRHPNPPPRRETAV
jgi:hypothetical protein